MCQRLPVHYRFTRRCGQLRLVRGTVGARCGAVIMLTAKGEDTDYIVGPGLGADNYLPGRAARVG